MDLCAGVLAVSAAYNNLARGGGSRRIMRGRRLFSPAMVSLITSAIVFLPPCRNVAIFRRASLTDAMGSPIIDVCGRTVAEFFQFFVTSRHSL